MPYFTIDLFIDMMILLLHRRDGAIVPLINKIIEIYEEETKETSYMDNEFFNFYIDLIREIIFLNIYITSTTEIETMVLKAKSNPLLLKDPEMYSALKKVLTEQTIISDDKYKFLVRRLSNSILYYDTTKYVKKMFGHLANGSFTAMPDKQEQVLTQISSLCNELVTKNNTTTDNDGEENRSKFLDFCDKDSIAKSIKVYKTTSVANVFRTGLQGMNRAFGVNGGWTMGSSIVFNAMAHGAKQLRNSEPIKIPGGWKCIGDLQVGDIVTAWDGVPSTVTGVFPQGVKDIYELHFADERAIDAGPKHLWTLCTEEGVLTDTVDTEEIISRLEKNEQLYIPLVKNLPDTDHEKLKCMCRVLEIEYMQDDSFWIDSSTPVNMIEFEQLIYATGGCVTIENFSDEYEVCVAYHITYPKALGINRVVHNGRAECTCISINHPDKLYIAGDYIVTHNTMMLLKMARWQVSLNKVTENFRNPTCIIYSLENETPQNLMLLYHEMYCNLYRVPPPRDMTEEQIIEMCHTYFTKQGWRLVIDRRLGAEFGFAELVANFEEYIRLGFTPLMCVIDYMNMLKKGTGQDENQGNWLLLRNLYTNVCNYLKSKNCTLVTAHQLNRKAADIASQVKIGAVKKFDISMLADGMDPQREIDIAFYQHKELDINGRAFLTFKKDKHRYDNTTKEDDKYFAYMFEGELGILDDVDGPDMSLKNIHSAPSKSSTVDKTEMTEVTTVNLFGD